MSGKEETQLLQAGAVMVKVNMGNNKTSYVEARACSRVPSRTP